jgi:hypothetical protein
VTGAGKRSVERLFQQEIGMTFGKWRQQVRLMQGCGFWPRAQKSRMRLWSLVTVRRALSFPCSGRP